MNLCLTLEIIQMGTDRPQDFTGISILPNESHSVWQYNPLTHPRCGCTPDVDAPQMFSVQHIQTPVPQPCFCVPTLSPVVPKLWPHHDPPLPETFGKFCPE